MFVKLPVKYMNMNCVFVNPSKVLYIEPLDLETSKLVFFEDNDCIHSLHIPLHADTVAVALSDGLK